MVLYKKSLSTFDSLNKISSFDYSEVDNKNSIIALFMDLNKAFDTVNYKILLDKLHFYEIRGCIHTWFINYLSDRTQSSSINKHLSNKRLITRGVPQGRILGPILFLIYINDLPNVSDNLIAILFADDSTFYLSGPNPHNLLASLNTNIKKKTF